MIKPQVKPLINKIKCDDIESYIDKMILILKSHISNFDINYFAMSVDDVIKPSNMVTALWINGIDVKPSDANGDIYENDVMCAVFDADKGSLFVTAKNVIYER